MTSSRDPSAPPLREALDAAALDEPAGYVVLVEAQERIHFLDWTAPGIGGRGERGSEPPGRAGVLLIHGLAQTAFVWAPIARRLIAPRLNQPRPIAAMDLRGHGLSDAPTSGYDLATLASDAVAVAEGSGALDDPAARLVVVGHGFGAIVAAAAAVALGARCSGVVLVDGGWEHLETATAQGVEEFLRALEEPPEVLSSLAAYLADRAAFDPATWDRDQEAAARAAVVELPSGRVVSATRPHVLESCVRSMFDYDPLETLTAVASAGTPIHVLAAAEDEAGGRMRALGIVGDALAAIGRPIASRRSFPAYGHNLMRYRPDDVAAAILAARPE